MDFPNHAFTDERQFREEMIYEWVRGSDSIAADVIAKWIMEFAQEQQTPKATTPPPSPPAATPPAATPPAATPPAVEALAVSYPDAAAMLGYSLDHFTRHVVPDLRVIVKGRRKTVTRDELLQWIQDNSARALKD